MLPLWASTSAALESTPVLPVMLPPCSDSDATPSLWVPISSVPPATSTAPGSTLSAPSASVPALTVVVPV